MCSVKANNFNPLPLSVALCHKQVIINPFNVILVYIYSLLLERMPSALILAWCGRESWEPQLLDHQAL